MKKVSILPIVALAVTLAGCAQTPTKVVADESSYYAAKGETMPTTLQSVVQKNHKPDTSRGKVPTNIQTPN